MDTVALFLRASAAGTGFDARLPVSLARKTRRFYAVVGLLNLVDSRPGKQWAQLVVDVQRKFFMPRDDR
ncbi:MAG: hypothetical protein H6Q51_1376 [Deltaproteobacteria bacterium]|jgi:hypothetical protein|nr:hypothetical protein [Deltaproteobacteria bacterium]